MTTIAAPLPQTRSSSGRPLKVRVRIWSRAVTDIVLVLLWLPATLSGVILWAPLGVVPEGPGKGEREMLWGYTTGQWGEIHWWLSAAAVGFTLLHILLNLRAFKGAIKYLVRARGIPS